MKLLVPEMVQAMRVGNQSQRKEITSANQSSLTMRACYCPVKLMPQCNDQMEILPVMPVFQFCQHI